MQNPNKGGRCEDNKSTRNKKCENIIHCYDSLHIQFKVMSTFICIYSFMFQNNLNIKMSIWRVVNILRYFNIIFLTFIEINFHNFF